MAERIKRPTGYDPKVWKTLSKQEKRLAEQQASSRDVSAGFELDENGESNFEVPFIGAPGGRIYNPNTQQYEGYSFGSPTQLSYEGDQIYGVENLGLGSFMERPKYVQGDEYKPGDFEKIKRLQGLMYAANMYGSEGEFVVGVWGPDDIVAYKNVLAAANANFMSDEEWLNAAIANPSMRIKAKQSRAPLKVVLTDPDDLKAVMDSTARTVFGRNIELPEEFKNSLIGSFHEIQRQRQIQNYNIDEVGGEIVDSPNPSSYVEQRIKEQYPVQSQYDEVADVMNTVFQSLGLASG